MFPAPSPNSQALFQQLQSGGATPGTLDFHRTAMNAAARSKTNAFAQPSSNPAEQPVTTQAMDSKPVGNDPFVNHDAEAANGLFMLAKGGQNNTTFAVPNQPVQPIQAKQENTMQSRNNRNNGSIGSMSAISGPDQSASGDQSDEQDEHSKSGGRGKGKKNNKGTPNSNGRRKADETPQKGSNKRAKGNNGNVVDPALERPEEDDDGDDSEEEQQMKDGRKMTDEEKRKNFLERNRYV